MIKKMKLFLSLICCIFILVSCGQKDEVAPLSSPHYHFDGLALYVYPEVDYPNPSDLNNLLYSVTNKEEDVTITLSKNERYIFEVLLCELDSKTTLETNVSVYNTTYAGSSKIIYEPTLLEAIDYGYIGDFDDNPWEGKFGTYYIRNISTIEETTIGFYVYPDLIKVKLQFK